VLKALLLTGILFFVFTGTYSIMHAYALCMPEELTSDGCPPPIKYPGPLDNGSTIMADSGSPNDPEFLLGIGVSATAVAIVCLVFGLRFIGRKYRLRTEG
jgi:hypothetical protein